MTMSSKVYNTKNFTFTTPAYFLKKVKLSCKKGKWNDGLPSLL
jgi:hypothetical protein